MAEPDQPPTQSFVAKLPGGTQITLQGVTLGTLVTVAMLAKGAFDEQIRATEQTQQALEHVQTEARELSHKVEDVRRMTEENRGAQREFDKFREQVSNRLTAIEICIRDKRRCPL